MADAVECQEIDENPDYEASNTTIFISSFLLSVAVFLRSIVNDDTNEEIERKKTDTDNKMKK